MSKVSRKVVNWLYTVIQPQYVHKKSVYTDTIRFLEIQLSKGFKIRTSVFVSPNGTSELLLCTSGTLDCANGVVPITIWIPLNYPFADPESLNKGANGVPIVFVVPPQDSSICPGNNVDAQGRFYHPYLSQWYSAERSPTFSSDFNLLQLIECLQNTFNREKPLRARPQGPTVPPKTSNIPSPAVTSPRRQVNAPPLPGKPDAPVQDNTVPARYRSPPPLPLYESQRSPPNISSSRPIFPSTESTDGIRSQSQPKEHTKTSLKQAVASEPIAAKNVSANVEDLMDQLSLETETEQLNENVIRKLSQQIEKVIDNGQPDSINQIIRHVSKVHKDTEQLGEHLSHHNTQAKANSDNLEKHITYLKEKVENIGALNGKLAQIKDSNKSTIGEVHLGNEVIIDMDDIIVPDSALVSQLYETVSEIKACKDCIKLIEGGFPQEPELINNDTLDACVKSVRATSRDLFWLEVTKDQVAVKMGLQH